MVSIMDTGTSNAEEVRSSSTEPSSVSSVTTVNCNSARHSPKISASMVPSPSPSLLQRNSSSPSVPKKIISKNHNNTVFATTFPSNLAELQLYRVMQNASLLYYYDTLLEMGGDDVQQLCDAGEEEFLEIMSLVGMASKPLHVRRLQKSLQEWVTNPTKFKIPLVPGEDFEIELSSPRITGSYYALECSDSNRSLYSPSPAESLPPVTSPGLSINKRPYSPLDTTTCPPSSSSSPGNTSLHMTPSLLESQISKLAAAAERLSKHLPQFEPKPHNAKKKMCKELELVMSMPETDPRRMDEIRRYAAIYGRFDCKRRPEKPLTLHEVSVNEAAAQICRFIPALLTRRDELFPLARQVVKDSGCHYSKVQYTSIYVNRNSQQDREVLDMLCSGKANARIPTTDPDGVPTAKRQKMDVDSENDEQTLKRQDRNSEDLITSKPHLNTLFNHHTRIHQNRDSSRRSSSLVTDDETDSHFSYSNSCSPCQISSQDQDSYGNESNTCQSILEEQTDLDDTNKLSPKVQVIAASGDNIIAVANPALAMSPAILPLAIETREHTKMIDQ